VDTQDLPILHPADSAYSPTFNPLFASRWEQYVQQQHFPPHYLLVDFDAVLQQLGFFLDHLQMSSRPFIDGRWTHPLDK
jgi:hypothetical protein